MVHIKKKKILKKVKEQSSRIKGIWNMPGWIFTGTRRQAWSWGKRETETHGHTKAGVPAAHCLPPKTRLRQPLTTAPRTQVPSLNLSAVLAKTSISADEKGPYEAAVDACFKIHWGEVWPGQTVGVCGSGSHIYRNFPCVNECCPRIYIRGGRWGT